jgi:hypothetical protein
MCADKVSFTLFCRRIDGTVHYLSMAQVVPQRTVGGVWAGRILQLDNFRSLRGYGWPGFSKMNLWRQDKGQAACAAAFVDAIRLGLQPHSVRRTSGSDTYKLRHCGCTGVVSRHETIAALREPSYICVNASPRPDSQAPAAVSPQAPQIHGLRLRPGIGLSPCLPHSRLPGRDHVFCF